MIDLSPNFSIFFSKVYDKVVETFTPAAPKSSPLSVRVEFLPEEHIEGGHLRTRNIEYLFAHYSYARGDIILVEDDETKPKFQLHLSQIGQFQNENCRIKGWDNHNSCEDFKKNINNLKVIENSVNKLEEIPLPCHWYEDLNLVFNRAKSVQLEAWQKYNKDDVLDCFTNAKRNEEKTTLLQSMKNYLSNAKAYFELKDFPKRQINLEKSVLESHKDTEGTDAIIYVMTGTLHTDTTNKKVGEFTRTFFDSLKNKNVPFRVL